jgi:Tol biopolymer transport system component
MRLVCTCIVAASVLVNALNAQVSLVSSTSSGSNSGYEARAPSVSADGRFVAFLGGFSGVSADAIFVKDRALGVLTAVSVATGGGQAYSGEQPSISADGRFIAFASNDFHLVPGDTNGRYDVFVHDRTTVTTTRVSVSSSGAQADYLSWTGHASISGDGRLVVFESTANNLVPGDTNSAADVFLHDRANATTQLVSVGAAGGVATGASRYPLISADGRFVAFSSTADDIVLPDNLPSVAEIYVRDLVAGTTSRVSLNSTGAQSPGAFVNLNAYNDATGGISVDGRFVAFISGVGLDSAYPNFGGLYLRDRIAGTTRLVSVPPTALQQYADVEGGGMSRDGRFVVYDTREKVTPDDANTEIDVFMRDMQLGTQVRVSRELTGQIAGYFQNANLAVITPDARIVVFGSESKQLSPVDMDDSSDIYAFDWSQVAPTSYCTAGASTVGCSATLSTLGSPSGSVGSGFIIQVTGAEGQRTGLLLYGISGRQAAPWGASSLSCVAPPRQRCGLRSTAGTAGQCNGAFSVDWNTFVSSHPSALGAPVLELTPVQAQAFIRDTPSPTGVVLTDAIEFYAVP